MKKCLFVSIAFMLMIAGTLEAQSVLSRDFESNNIGDTLFTVGWSIADIQSVISDDPLASGNKVLKNTVHNYNAAPVLMFVLPAGKTLADYDTLTFKGYFQKGDVAYKYILAQAYQTMPAGHHFLDTDTLGSYNRAQGASSAWENISLDISNASSFSDTVYIALGINCAGTSGADTTTWFADDVTLVEKPAVVGPILGTEQDFESYSIGDSLAHISWNPSDIQSVISDDPVTSGNNVLKNIVHNYNAAPVLTFVLPSGKTLADYGSLTFKGYFQKGDVAYKGIVAEVYQTKPTGHFLDTDTLGLYNRAMGASTNWENISLDISNSSTFSDTIYIALGINCAGTSGADTTTWYADDIKLVAKVITPPSDTGNVVTNGGFEDSNTGVVDTTDVKGWLILVASGVTPPPVFEIVSDTVEEGNRALKVTVHGLGTNQWDVQTVADSLHITSQVTYDYSIWAKAEAPGAQVNFTVGGYSTGEYGAIRPANLTTSWKKYTMSFKVTTTDTVIRGPIHFNYAGNTDNAIYIDNLRIAKHIEVVDSSLVWKGPALATGSPKFFGSAGDSPANDFKNYWTQLTPENSGKFGSVAISPDTSTWNWGPLDVAYNYAINNNLIFKEHCLIWGSQQPSWLSGMDRAQQAEAVETWIRKVGERYPKMDFVDVVNEAMPGHSQPFYKNALGDSTTTWGWVIWAFQKARQYMPNAKLILNEYNIMNGYSTQAYIKLVDTLKVRGLIDGIGVQGHRDQWENQTLTTLSSNLNKLTATGIPVYISEMDVAPNNIVSDSTQLAEYQRVFPLVWKNPSVKGITIWGYKEGMIGYFPATYLVRADGTARPALFWLAQYIKDNPTDVGETISILPTKYELDQNFPNPFNPTTNIRYNIIKASKVTLKIYDILGREIKTLVNTEQAPGRYTVTFDAQNLSSGVYFYRINAGSFNATKKLMLLK